MKGNKGLSDKELVAKYEAGSINLSKVLEKSTDNYTHVKRIVSDPTKKKEIN